VPLLRSTDIPLRATLLMDAPPGAVRRALRRTDVWTRTARSLGARAEVARVGRTATVTAPRAPLEAGDLIRVRRDAGSELWPARSLILRVDSDTTSEDTTSDDTTSDDTTSDSPGDGRQPPLPSLHLLAGPLGRCTIRLTVASTGAGTLVTVDVRIRAAPAVRTPMLRRRALAGAQLLLGIALLAAREVQVVVAGAVLHDGKVLVARRTAPSALAGFWELPGGKVNPGETERDALRRELDEELGLSVSVAERVGPDIDLGDNMLLRCYLARSEATTTSPNEHDAVQWVDLDGLDTVNWLEPDRAILPALRRWLLAENRPISPW